MAYSNKDETSSIIKAQTSGKIDYCWLKNLRNNKILTKRFQRTELFALKSLHRMKYISKKLIKNRFIKKISYIKKYKGKKSKIKSKIKIFFRGNKVQDLIQFRINLLTV